MMGLCVSVSVCVRLPAAVLSETMQSICLSFIRVFSALAFPALSIT